MAAWAAGSKKVDRARDGGKASHRSNWLGFDLAHFLVEQITLDLIVSIDRRLVRTAANWVFAMRATTNSDAGPLEGKRWRRAPTKSKRRRLRFVFSGLLFRDRGRP